MSSEKDKYCSEWGILALHNTAIRLEYANSSPNLTSTPRETQDDYRFGKQ